MRKEKLYKQSIEKLAANVSLDKNLEKVLRLRISELEQQAKEYPEMVRQVEQLEEANIDLGNEICRLLLLVDDKSVEIKQLKDAATDLEDEIGDLSKENKLIKALLKEVL